MQYVQEKYGTYLKQLNCWFGSSSRLCLIWVIIFNSWHCIDVNTYVNFRWKWLTPSKESQQNLHCFIELLENPKFCQMHLVLWKLKLVSILSSTDFERKISLKLGRHEVKKFVKPAMFGLLADSFCYVWPFSWLI